MKFNTFNRTATAVALSLALGLGTIACSRDYTADYVYSVSNSTGSVSAFAVDYQSGVLTQISGSPFTTNLQNPTTVISAPNGKTIYVIGGSYNANVEVMTVGTDGKLYGQATPSITGTYPTAAAIDSTGSFLYVTYTYQSQGNYSPNNPGPGGISIFQINADGTLGTPTNVNVGNNPVAIATATPTCTTTPAITSNTACSTGGTPNSFVYVVDAETTSTLPTVLGFAENTTTGALTQIMGTNANNGFNAGVAPSAIAVDPAGEYVYVTDKQQNEVIGYQIARETTGALSAVNNSPFATGEYPLSVVVDPRDKYVYVANYNSNTVSSYSLNQANGSLGASAGSGFTTTTGPTCVTIDPALGIYLYTSDYLNGAISGGELSPDTGQLTTVANSFFSTGAQPACLTSVANGAHAVQIVQQ